VEATPLLSDTKAMRLLRRPPRHEKRDEPLSFRFSAGAVERLRILAEFCCESQVGVLEQLINAAYDEERKRDPSGMRKAAQAVEKPRPRKS
jgi:hypothetical protein